MVDINEFQSLMSIVRYMEYQAVSGVNESLRQAAITILNSIHSMPEDVSGLMAAVDDTSLSYGQRVEALRELGYRIQKQRSSFEYECEFPPPQYTPTPVLLPLHDGWRPTVNGSGISFADEILFTSPSGQLLEDLAGNIGSGNVNRLNGLTQLVQITGVSGIDISTSGQHVLIGVIFGDQARRYIEDDEQTTSSTSFQTALSETTHSLPLGTYRIGWSYDFRCDSADRIIGTRLTVDSTILHDQEADVGHGQNHYYSTGGFGYIQLEGATNLLFQFRRAGSGGTHRVRNVRIEIWRVRT